MRHTKSSMSRKKSTYTPEVSGLPIHSHSLCKRLKTHFDIVHFGIAHFSHCTQSKSWCWKVLGFCSGNGSLIHGAAAMRILATGGTKQLPRATATDWATCRGNLAAGDASWCSSQSPQSPHTHF